jgi:pimeloyl-ACP methyl ester carboxylesterase
MKIFFAVPILVFTAFISSCLRPARDIEAYDEQKAPDYSQEKYWAALPFRKDSADFVPAGTGDSDQQEIAAADVFYIHPTLYFGRKSWNADIDDRKINERIDKATMKQQASVFNGSCRVYAPRYRQATLYAFLDTKENGRKALDEAYEDVREAFVYYLGHYNAGRPIVIAGHSQGTYLALKLMEDFFDKDPELRKRLVAAYLIGGGVTRGQFTNLVPCDDASQTGCYVAWHSMKWGSPEKAPRPGHETAIVFDSYGRNECVNPLTWKRDTVYAPPELNKGGLPRGGEKLDPAVADAKISPEFVLWIHQPEEKGYPRSDNYHIADYSLFYMNIRANVAERVAEFLRQ